MFQSLAEHDGYAILSMGRSHDLGCHCSVNGLLREVLPRALGSAPADDELARLNRAERPLTDLDASSPALYAIEHLCEHLPARL